MKKNYFFSGLLTLAICFSLSCKKNKNNSQPQFPCVSQLTDNTAAFSGVFNTMRFDSTDVWSADDDTYFSGVNVLQPDSNLTSISFLFGTNVRPTAGIYKIKDLPVQPAELTIYFYHITDTNDLSIDIYQAGTGIVKIEEINSKIKASFCDVLFKNTENSSISFTCSAVLKEK
jgi:hypothetical protein